MKKAPVTDHALLRYIERVLGIDTEDAKRTMMTPEITSAIKLGAASYTQNGATYIFKNKKIITVLDESGSNNHG